MTHRPFSFSRNTPPLSTHNAARSAIPSAAMLPAPAITCAAAPVTWMGAEEVVRVAFLDAGAEDAAAVLEVEREEAADVVSEVATTAALEVAVVPLLATGAGEVVAGGGC